MSADRSRLAVRAVVAIYREFEQKARRADISMAQYRLLLYLRNGPQRAGAVAAAAELAKPTVSLALKGLRDRGWVENAADSDGRAAVIVITEAGHARIAGLEHDLAGVMRAMLAADDMAELSAALASAYVAMAATKEERMNAVERGLVE